MSEKASMTYVTRDGSTRQGVITSLPKIITSKITDAGRVREEQHSLEIHFVGASRPLHLSPNGNIQLVTSGPLGWIAVGEKKWVKATQVKGGLWIPSDAKVKDGRERKSKRRPSRRS